MPHRYNYTVAERFLRYVQIDTQSDPNNYSHPSTEKQKNLANLLATELQAMGLENAHADEYGYVYASIPATSAKKIPSVCFCAHIDTAPDCSGTDVKPLVHNNYNGNDILLPDDSTQIISKEKYPYLLKQIGQTIITASGKTLLGGDDKAGVSIIMDMANYLMQHPEVLHGSIQILFTPDEEVGRGTEKLDLEKLGADYAYTLDGGALGDFEDETFSADAVTIEIQGVIAHPGDGKNKLVNALKIGAEILAALPKDGWSPETTEKREGFVHPVAFEGGSEKASIEFIIRDFDTNQLAVHENKLQQIAKSVMQDYPRASMRFTVKEQYRNMKEILDQHPAVSSYAKEAYQKLGVQVNHTPIRGGTDGSRLSFMGLPCANLFTGMQAIHSKHEWISVNDMEKSVQVLIELVQVWESHA